MPFVTEELWLELCSQTGVPGNSIMRESLPDINQFASDVDAENEVEWIKAFVVGIRQIRGEMNISPNKKLPVKLADTSNIDRTRVQKHKAYLTTLARLDSVEVIDDPEIVGKAAIALIGKMRMLVPMSGLINIDIEISRLEKHRLIITADLSKAEVKLGNLQFLSNAPKNIVEKEKKRSTDLRQKLEQLDAQINRLQTTE